MGEKIKWACPRCGKHGPYMSICSCAGSDAKEIKRLKDLLWELVELVESEPVLTAEKWVEKLNQLSKQAKREIGDE